MTQTLTQKTISDTEVLPHLSAVGAGFTIQYNDDYEGFIHHADGFSTAIILTGKLLRFPCAEMTLIVNLDTRFTEDELIKAVRIIRNSQ